MQISYEDFVRLFDTHFVDGKSEWMLGLTVNQAGIWKGGITERELSFLSPEEKGEIFTLCEVKPTKPMLPFPTTTSQLEKLMEDLGGCREEFERYDKWMTDKPTPTTTEQEAEPQPHTTNPEQPQTAPAKLPENHKYAEWQKRVEEEYAKKMQSHTQICSRICKSLGTTHGNLLRRTKNPRKK